MKKERFDFVCMETEAGNDAFVKHPASKEEGLVRSCSLEHVMVETSDGNRRCWDYRECEEMSRGSEEWPWR